MSDAIISTDFSFPGQKSFYKGKVRDVYNINNDYLVMVVSDRISAFDVVLPKGIPFKGQVLNQIAAKFLDATADIVPNWKIATPDPMVTVGHLCEPFKVEMVIRGYLTGHAWRQYRAGIRKLCGISMPDGMKESQAFPEPIITPTTKAAEGHDEDISREDIIKQGLVSAEEYAKLEEYTYSLFRRGTLMAAEKGCRTDYDTRYVLKGAIDLGLLP
jgi:phosphoribosylaminoimidazole-succinocarboxamide synthase